jgi:hypothetical protein
VAAFLDRLIDRPRPTGLLKSALQHFYGVFWIWILRFRLGFWEFIGIGLHAVSCLRPRLTGPASRWSLWLTWKRERIGLIFTDETTRAWAKGTGRQTWCSFFCCNCRFFFSFISFCFFFELASMYGTLENAIFLFCSFVFSVSSIVNRGSKPRQIT